MKLFYVTVLILMVLVSACAQQAAPVVTPQPSEQPSAPEEEQPEAEPAENIPTAPATANEVKILGVGQYDPEEVTIKAGGSITFFNEGKFKSVITIKSKSGVTNTPIVNSGDKYEQEFAEAGEYDVWAVAYGPGVKVTVK